VNEGGGNFLFPLGGTEIVVDFGRGFLSVAGFVPREVRWLESGEALSDTVAVGSPVDV
jgi:hypothetical protein